MSTTIAALIFLPLAPVAAAFLHWRSKRAAQRRAVRQFAEDVETWTVIRHRG
ncbi:hypothetical protein ACWGIV_36995 [Streptomyces sp. NPDC054844]